MFEIHAEFEGRGQLTPGFRALMVEHGFRELSDAGKIVRFRRSNRLTTFFSFGPDQWRIDLEVFPRRGQMRMAVFTTGQIVTPGEREYFRALSDEIVQALEPHTNPDGAMVRRDDTSTALSRSVTRENVLTMFGFFAFWPISAVALATFFSVPFLWAILWGFLGSTALSYAWLFSIRKHRRDADQP